MSEETKTFTTVKEAYERHDRGKRRKMEDSYTMINNLFEGVEGKPELGYFALFDGHGGKTASEWASKNLHVIITEELASKDTNAIDAAFMEHCFTEADQKMIASGVEYPGCTATVCIVDKANSTLHVANVGDSHAYLIVKGADAPVRLTTEHRCTNPEEKARIESLGGFVTGDRVNGLMDVTRSLGDGAMKTFLTAVPAYNKVTYDPAVDTVVVIACDGLWDYVPPKEVENVIRTNESALVNTPSILITTAIRAKTTDNISAMVIRL